MTRARNIAGFSTITTTPSPVHVGPIGVLTATRIDGEFNVVDITSRDITAQGIGVTNLQVSGITTGLNVSGIITAQNGINFNGTSTGLNVSGVSTITTLDVNGNGDISGNLTVGGNATITGVLTYEDVTRVDSVGVVTARGLSIFGNTTGLQVASGISTFQAVTATTAAFSGEVDIADKIVHNGDTDTAIRFPAADTISFETAGSERFRLDSSGRLLYGHTSNVTGSLFQINSGANFFAASNDANGAVVDLIKTRSTTPSGNTILQDGDKIGELRFRGNTGAGNVNGAVIQAIVNGTPGSGNDLPTDLVFRLQPDGSGNTGEVARIKSDGKMGLGTNNPQAILHIEHTTPGIHLSDTGNSGAYAFFDANAANAIIHADKGNTVSNSRVAFAVDNDEKMRITSDGKLLVGRTSGSFALDVETGSDSTLRISNSGESGHGSHDAKIVAGGSYYQNPTIVGREIKFRTFNSSATEGERARIDEDGKVGIGEDSPLAQLHIKPASNIPQLLLEQNNAAHGYSLFQDGPNGGHLKFRRHIDGSETQTLLLRSDGGLCFGTDSAAANALDDYEEGTWTPVYVSSNSTISYSIQQGYYTKVGNVVTVSFYIRTSSVSSTSHSLVKVSGLPFAEGKSQRTPGSIRAFGFQSSGTLEGFPIAWTVEAGQTFGELLKMAATGTTDFTTSTMNNSSHVYGQAVYHAA